MAILHMSEIGINRGIEVYDQNYIELVASREQSQDFLTTTTPLFAANTTMNPTPAEDGYELSDLSDGQQIALVILQVSAAILSLVGSCTIVYKIVQGLCRRQTTTPYERIILGLSFADIVASFSHAIGPFLLPSETSQRVWASGSPSTCQTLGFLTQLSLWAMWYNCILSFYYLLTVRFQVKREEFCRKYETWMHLSGIVFFPITAVLGYFGRWYGEQALTMTCWVRDVPTDCDDDGTCSGNAAELVSYIYGAFPTLITFLSLIINNIVIYMFVRKSLLPSPQRRQNATDDVESDDDSQRETQSIAESTSVQEQLTREAAIQGFLYVFSFFITATPPFVLQVLDGSFAFEEDDQGRIYVLLVLSSILWPLQGFFNVFIYVKPSYSRFRAARPNQSRWLTLKSALFDPNIPRMSSTAGSSMAPISAAEKKHSKMKENCGSRFSMSLDNIIEEDGSTAESITTES